MDVSRLLSVIDDVEAEFKDGLSGHLASLIQQYTAARDTPAQDNTPAIQEAFETLVEYVDDGTFSEYPPSKAAVLSAIGGDRRVGKGFLERLNDILAVSGQTTAGIVTGLTSFRTDLSAFQKACSQARAGLDALELKSHAVPEGQFEVGVLIPERLVDSKLGTLVKELDNWNKIVRSYQEVAGDEEREVTVASLASGSYEIYLPVGIGAALLVSRTIDKVLEWYKKVLEIRKLRMELKELRAPVAEVSAIRKHEKNLVENGIKQLAKELVKEVNSKVDRNRRNELEAHLTVSIRQIARFVDRGGTVELDSTVPEEPEEPIEPEGEEVPPDQRKEYARMKIEFTRLRSDFERVSGILHAGGSLRQLPERLEPVLQLDEAECDDVSSTEKASKKESV